MLTFIIGFLFAIIISGYIHYQIIININGEQFGSVADWISGLGSVGAVITSLWLASDKRGRVKVTHSLKIDYIEKPERILNNTLSVIFDAYNKGNKPVTLEFYGFKKATEKDYIRFGDHKRKKVNPGESISNKFNVYDIERYVNLKNYSGKIDVCYNEPTGDKHTERFEWEDVIQAFKKTPSKKDEAK